MPSWEADGWRCWRWKKRSGEAGGVGGIWTEIVRGSVHARCANLSGREGGEKTSSSGAGRMTPGAEVGRGCGLGKAIRTGAWCTCSLSSHYEHELHELTHSRELNEPAPITTTITNTDTNTNTQLIINPSLTSFNPPSTKPSRSYINPHSLSAPYHYPLSKGISQPATTSPPLLTAARTPTATLP